MGDVKASMVTAEERKNISSDKSSVVVEPLPLGTLNSRAKSKIAIEWIKSQQALREQRNKECVEVRGDRLEALYPLKASLPKVVPTGLGDVGVSVINKVESVAPAQERQINQSRQEVTSATNLGRFGKVEPLNSVNTMLPTSPSHVGKGSEANPSSPLGTTKLSSLTLEERKKRHKEQMKRWREKNPDYNKTYRQKYYQEHRESILAKGRAKREAERRLIAEYAAQINATA